MFCKFGLVVAMGPDLTDQAQLTRLFEAHATELRRLGLELLNQLRQQLEA